MALLEDRTAVFIVRVWCERGDGDSAVAEWRGSVEHVRSGERAFFRNLDTMCEFMKPHLTAIGIDVQQRFWERIASVIDTPPDGSNTASLAITVPASPNLIPRSVPRGPRSRRQE